MIEKECPPGVCSDGFADRMMKKYDEDADGKLDAESRRHIPQPWQVIGNTLTQDRMAIGKAITREVFHRWVIDQHDL